MTRLCPWTVVLLACLCSAIGVRAFSAYDKKLELLSTIVNKDYLWKKIFLESIVYKLDRTYYQHIIDGELLKNARYQPPATDEVQGTPEAAAGEGGVTVEVEVSGGGDAGKTSGEAMTSSSTPPESEDRDRIIPYEFVRNIMLNNRYVVGSILDMGLQVLMVSFKCLLYKHMVHLTYLIRVEMKRNKNQKKAVSWAGKSKPVIESILMTMGALQFTDIHVLATLRFFDIYQTKGMTMESDVKDEYCNILETRSNEMLDFICKNCVEIPKQNDDISMEEQVAKMIGVSTNPGLYNVGGSFGDMSDYKEMIKESWLQLHFVFGDIPRINGMSKPTWNDIFKYQERFKLK